MATETATQRRKVPMIRFPGLWAAVAGAVQASLGYWGIWYGWPVIARYLREGLGFTAGDIGLAASAGRVATVFSIPAGGWVADHWGPRYGTILFLTLLSLALIAMISITAVWHMVLWYTIAIAFSFGGCYTISFPAVNRWWIDRRGLMVGIVTLGGGSSGVWGPPLTAWLTEAYGIIGMLWATGLATLVVCVGVAFLYPHHMPEHYGLYPDNITPEEQRERAEQAAARRGQRPVVRPPLADIATAQALRSYTFWVLVIAGLVASFAGAPVVLFQNIRMGALGYTPMEAAVFLTLRMIFTYVGRVGVMLFGDWLTARWSVRFAVSLCYLMEAIGTLFFALGTTAAFFWGWAVVDGIGFGALMPLLPMLMGAYFGRQAYGFIYGLRGGMASAGGVVAPLLVGWLSDVRRGDWVLPLLIIVGGYVLATMLYIFCTPPKAQAREQRGA